MGEAEQRHREIMQATVSSIRADFQPAMIKAVKTWFQEEFAAEIHTKFHWISHLEPRDQYHAEFNARSQEKLPSYFHNLFVLLDGQRRTEHGIAAAMKLPKKVAGQMHRIDDPLAGVAPMPDHRPIIGPALKPLCTRKRARSST